MGFCADAIDSGVCLCVNLMKNKGERVFCITRYAIAQRPGQHLREEGDVERVADEIIARRFASAQIGQVHHMVECEEGDAERQPDLRHRHGRHAVAQQPVQGVAELRSGLRGKIGELECLPEYRVELVCADEYIRPAITALRAAHPYETPAFDLSLLVDSEDF